MDPQMLGTLEGAGCFYISVAIGYKNFYNS